MLCNNILHMFCFKFSQSVNCLIACLSVSCALLFCNFIVMFNKLINNNYHIFQPIAMENLGAFSSSSLWRELGRRLGSLVVVSIAIVLPF